jgi:hypothetical protein
MPHAALLLPLPLPLPMLAAPAPAPPAAAKGEAGPHTPPAPLSLLLRLAATLKGLSGLVLLSAGVVLLLCVGVAGSSRSSNVSGSACDVTCGTC